MAINSKTVATLVSFFIFPIALALFASGFFPYKLFLPGLATFDEESSWPPPVFDRVIFMVVDALRRYYSSDLLVTVVHLLTCLGTAILCIQITRGLNSPNS